MNFPVALLSGVLFLVRILQCDPFFVVGASMEPNIHDGQLIFIEEVDEYPRGDVIVFEREDKSGDFWVKRVVGLPGETVKWYPDGHVVVDENLLEERYVLDPIGFVHQSSELAESVYQVPGGHYFVLGDNREESVDSRDEKVSFVQEENIIGRYVVDGFGFDRNEYTSGAGRGERGDKEVVSNLAKGSVVIETQNREIPFVVEIADTPEKQSQGLMFREELVEGAGMYFIFQKEQPRSFWMKNTLIPLDIIFIGKDGKIVSISENTPPCERDPCPNYPSGGLVQYVLEIGGGEAARLGIAVGDMVRLKSL